MTTEKAIEFGKIFLKTIADEKGSATYEFVETAVKMMEQQPILDKIRKRIELEKLGYPPSAGYYKAIMRCLQIIDKYKVESEENKNEKM